MHVIVSCTVLSCLDNAVSFYIDAKPPLALCLAFYSYFKDIQTHLNNLDIWLAQRSQDEPGVL